jgi:hypothetical protein
MGSTSHSEDSEFQSSLLVYFGDLVLLEAVRGRPSSQEFTIKSQLVTKLLPADFHLYKLCFRL